MRSRSRLLVSAGVLAALGLGVAAPAAAIAADDYTDPEYREHDRDNYTRARGRQIAQATSPDYHAAFAGVAAQTFLEAQGRQAGDVRYGRVYTGVGQYVSTFAAGDPETYHEVARREVFFLSRTGAKLRGHVWGSEAPGPRPGVVITTGSIQGSEAMYYWAAQALAARGYEVLTWDVQGQGHSEGTGHEPGSPVPTTDGVPSQQVANFIDGTVDALRFFLSTPGDPYRPTGWSDEDVATAKAASEGERLDWVNPGWGALDRDNLGIAGHSLGASAVSVVQQCSDEADLWRELDACGGRSFPIRAVVGWDSLGTEGAVPVVPGMDQRADGYFLSPSFEPQAPDPTETLDAFEQWRDAGLDAYLVTIRAGTHLEWTQIPYHGPATRYGVRLAAYYTAAWMDRWVPDDPRANRQGYAALLNGPVAEPELAWSANHFSARHLSALALHRPGAEAAPFAVDVVDLRKWAGRSEVGDWAGANADDVDSELP